MFHTYILGFIMIQEEILFRNFILQICMKEL